MFAHSCETMADTSSLSAGLYETKMFIALSVTRGPDPCGSSGPKAHRSCVSAVCKQWRRVHPAGVFHLHCALPGLRVEQRVQRPAEVFMPRLARTRREGLRQYSLLADTYNRAFAQKWVAGPAPPDEPLLGSADIQSLADLGNSFGMIRDMKPFPFSLQQILQIAVITSLPGLPLIFLVMPVGELLKLLAGALL